MSRSLLERGSKAGRGRFAAALRIASAPRKSFIASVFMRGVAKRLNNERSRSP
jgi:hypothetical protein